MSKKLTYTSKIVGSVTVELNMDRYAHYNNIYIGLVSDFGDGLEPYGDLTVNLCEVPDYYGFLDTNNLSGAEDFVVSNKLGTFTGQVFQSGFCTYPLYKFDVDRLKELCPSAFESADTDN